MIISNKYEWAFIHNPKACGTSIRQVLGKYHDAASTYWHQGWDKMESRVVDLAHLQASYWYSSSAVPAHFTTFGFVRDPYTRFISSMNETRRRHPQLFTSDSDFLKMLTPANIRYDWRFIHFCPQHTFFFHQEKRVVDFIGRFENLNDDWHNLRGIIGTRLNDIPKTLPHARPSASDHGLTPEMVQLVNDLYYRDFVLFSYKMNGTVSSDTYASRMEIIHDPAKFGMLDLRLIPFTPNERKALDAKMVTK